MLLCVRVSSQDSKQSCICVLGVSSQESKQSCICVLGVSILSLSTMLIFDLGISATVLYFVSFFHSITCYVYVYICESLPCSSLRLKFFAENSTVLYHLFWSPWFTSCLIYIICVCFRVVVSNTYCVVFVFVLCLGHSMLPVISINKNRQSSHTLYKWI
jgi:hypothetical protein